MYTIIHSTRKRRQGFEPCRRYTKQLLGCLALTGLLAGCSIDGGLLPQEPAAERIRFDRPAVGQTSRYVLLKGENFYDVDNQKFELLADTLILRIVAIDAQGILIEDQLSAGSASRKGAGYTGEADSIFRYRWTLRNDSIIQAVAQPDLGVRSHFGYYEFALPLRPITSEEADMTDWKVKPFCQEGVCLSFDPKHIQFGQTYTNLNLYSNNIPMTYDGPGALYAYSREAGFVRSSWYGEWRMQGYAWNLL
jgi:hypothetical protein